MEKLCSNLVALRKQTKKTQKEVADDLGVAPSAISAYENGSRLPALDFAIKLAQYYGVSLDKLCGIEAAQTGGPVYRTDIYRSLISLCANLPGVALRVFENFSAGQDVIQIYLPSNCTWLETFCNKFGSVLALYTNGTIDAEMLEAWTEKQINDQKGLLPTDDEQVKP